MTPQLLLGHGAAVFGEQAENGGLARAASAVKMQVMTAEPEVGEQVPGTCLLGCVDGLDDDVIAHDMLLSCV